MSSWPTRAARGIRASTDPTVGRGVAVGCRVGVGAGRVVVGLATGVGDAVVGVGEADASGVAAGSGGIVLHAVAAPSVTAAATATRARTPRRYDTLATPSAESA
jgi:hypothetical protein